MGWIPTGRPRKRVGNKVTNREEQGFTLVEVLTSIVVLGLIGVAATYLMLRLTRPIEATLRYEQQSLAANAAADRIWGLFRADDDKPPAQCDMQWQPEDPDWKPNGPWAHIDVNYDFTFRCVGYPEGNGVSDRLFVVRVWLRRKRDGHIEEPFEMLALVGGYSAGDETAEND